MRKRPFIEWLLSQEIGAERATAVLGDLEELAATRGRLWFWAMYLRAVVSFGWRTAIPAFLAAFVCSRLLIYFMIPFFFRLSRHHLSDPGLFGETNWHVSIIAWNFSIATVEFFCFLLPFAAIRYGSQRITRLAAILFVLAAPVYCWTPWIMDLSVLLIAIVILCALAMPRWHRPMLTLLLAAVLANGASWIFLLPLRTHYRRNYMDLINGHPSLFLLQVMLTFAFAAFICIRREKSEVSHQPFLAA
jgi:hypothetical protein